MGISITFRVPDFTVLAIDELSYYTEFVREQPGNVFFTGRSTGYEVRCVVVDEGSKHDCRAVIEIGYRTPSGALERATPRVVHDRIREGQIFYLWKYGWRYDLLPKQRWRAVRARETVSDEPRSVAASVGVLALMPFFVSCVEVDVDPALFDGVRLGYTAPETAE